MRICSILLTVLLLAGASFSADAGEVQRKSGGLTTDSRPEIAPHIVFIKLRQQVNFYQGQTATGLSGIDRVLDRVNARSVQPLHRSPVLRKGNLTPAEANLARIVKVRYDADVDPYELAKELSADINVEYAEPCYVFNTQHTPNDPRFGTQWSMSMLKMEEAWDVTTGDSTVVIGYIDTGVNYNHEDLANSIWINPGEWGSNGELKDNGVDDDGNGYVDDYRGWDFLGGGDLQQPIPDNDPMDLDGHGTNGAGIAAATTNNDTGMAGAGYKTRIYPIKAENDAGTSGISGYDAIPYAADMGCKVINCSWGSNASLSLVLQDVINYAYSKGAVVVGAAGNRATDNDFKPYLPSSLNHVLSVSSLEKTGDASMETAFGVSVDVYSPGVDIVAPRLGWGYTTVTGTSFATPLMSGLAALVWSIHPDWTPDQVMKQIRVSADQFDPTPDAKYYGRANAFAAVSKNTNLDEIPGLVISSSTVSTPAGGEFTEGGQTADVELVLENILGATSAGATAMLEFDPTLLSSTSSSFSLGEMMTNDTKTLNFSVTLDDNPWLSEGYVPVTLKITDGQFVDFVLLRIPINIEAAWRSTPLTLLYPYNSIHMVDRWTIWVNGNFSENGVPTQDIALVSTNGGEDWFFAFGPGFPSGAGVYCIRGVDPATALVGTGPQDGNAGIYRTQDAGASWSGYSVSDMTPFVNWIHMFDADNGVFQGDPLGGNWAIGKTTDGGRSWSRVAATLPAAASEAGWNNSYDFVGDIGWFGTNSSLIYKTVDGGETWTGYGTPSKNSIDVSFRDEMTGVARFSRQGDQGTDTLAISRDGGLTWNIITTVDVLGGSVQFERGGERLWYLNTGNAFLSTDIGATWSAEPAPYDFEFISDITSWNDGFDSYMFATGIKIFKFFGPFTEVTSVERIAPSPMNFTINQLYPNPFNGTASSDIIADFSLNSVTDLTMTIYDMNGRMVRKVFGATMAPGNHSLRIGAQHLSAGTYTLQLRGGGSAVHKSFVVVK